MARSPQPVLVGSGQLIDRPASLTDAKSPLTMMQETARACAIDAGLKADCWGELDVLVVVNSVGPTLISNPPAALANRLGAGQARHFLTATGGNTPQMLVNHFAGEIARGHASMVLLAGAEALDSLARSVKSGETLDWEADDTATAPRLFSAHRPGSNDTEQAHGMVAPIVTYPLFENALRKHYGRSTRDHQLALGRLFAPFSRVASNNPYAWFPVERSATEIASPTVGNRYIGFPYTKYMNAVMQVNQSASVLLTSDEKARALGIDESRWVYLHGCADVNDIWHVSERINHHSSPALSAALTSTFDMARTSADEIDLFDIYSCFPAVVEVTRDALGMTEADSRLLTVTGGLPYFGGAGNNYSMHAIATMMDRLRQRPGERGLVTANGWYLTKHALGIYAAGPPATPFEPPDTGPLNRTIAAMPHPTMDPRPSGTGTIETFTVLFDRSGEPERGLVLGRLENGARFVAHTSQDKSLLLQMTHEDPIDRRGSVTAGADGNRFEFDL
ncbi:MAG: acetyl-CoA acetyltransferase [Pseudomonadales bacterium]|nr:acetyl-CoA acetyltransferase [Pseudomonadales bacterium]